MINVKKGADSERRYELLFAPADLVELFYFSASKPQRVVCRQGRNAARVVVKFHPFSDANSGFWSGIRSMQIDTFKIQRPQEPFDEDVVEDAAFAIHRDAHVRRRNLSVQAKDVNWVPWTPF